MTVGLRMSQLNPHLPVRSLYFIGLIRILKTAKGRAENGIKGGGGMVRKQRRRRCVGV